MAVHVPLGPEAQVEAKLLMMATRNILKPAHGDPIAVPELDIVLGCSFLTKSIPEYDWKRPEAKLKLSQPKHFINHDEVLLAHGNDQLHLHDPIDLHFEETNGNPIRTTVGRVIFNQIVPNELMFVDMETNFSVPFVNQEMHAGDLSNLVSRCFEELGNRRTVDFLHKAKQLGFHYATLSGISIGINDLIVPEEKKNLIQQAWHEVDDIENDFSQGEISPGERYNKIINVWLDRIDQIEKALFVGLEKGRQDEIEGFNPIHIMADSGARSKKASLRQISGLRGLMAKPSGEIIEHPIESCFREGLSVLEYFTSTHGARKGLADTAIKTASSGYLTRKLVDVAQDVMITIEDCYTSGYIIKTATEEAEIKISAQIFGRTFSGVIDQETDRIISTTIIDENNEIVVTQDQPISRHVAETVERLGYTKIAVRSALSCEAARGICAKCYGADLSTGQPVDQGEAVGIIAAQSIGEPGTLLTMRTFHTGGTASGDVIESKVTASNAGKAYYHGVDFIDRLVETDNASVSEKTEVSGQNRERVVVSKQNAELQIRHLETDEILERHNLPVGSRLFVQDGSIIEVKQPLSEFDPYRIPILTKQTGYVSFDNIVEGRTFREDKTSGLAERVISEYKGDSPPRIEIRSEDGVTLSSYLMPVGAHLSVIDGSLITEGSILARLPKEAAKSSDIVSGLPRITELFEARKPKDAAFMAEIDGVVEIQGISRGMHILKIINSETGVESKAARIPVGKYLLVDEGDEVKTGDPLTGGSINPHDILDSKGLEEVQAYLIDEVQAVYRSQGEQINDKHIEVIIRQMLDKVIITDAGDTELLEEEEISRARFEAINERVRNSQNGSVSDKQMDPEDIPLALAQAKPILQGITKAALSTDSFISAASFQQTTSVLTKAAVAGKSDPLSGLKENVIMGHLIPAGTGVADHRLIEAYVEGEEQNGANDEITTNQSPDILSQFRVSEERL